MIVSDELSPYLADLIVILIGPYDREGCYRIQILLGLIEREDGARDHDLISSEAEPAPSNVFY